MSVSDYDVIIVGAGLSGIGAAVHLKQQCPDKRVLILESREGMGGTWDLFRYPGIRSDSDMYTLGYSFKPWVDSQSIADGETILEYIKGVAAEYQVEDAIRYNHKVVAANWDSVTARWQLQTQNAAGELHAPLHCQFLLCCTGYYNYDAGYDPGFKGREQFQGTIIHPQHWPEGFDYSDKRIVVIGSGATAITLVPSLADKAAHVTMLQRSPSYVVSLPKHDALSHAIRKVLPDAWVYHAARSRNLMVSMGLYQASRAYPQKMRSFLQAQTKKAIGHDVDMKHFSPRYNPWDERLCVVPDGDLFEALKSGRASVVTDQIERFTSQGIELVSGDRLDADVIVTATGLDIQFLGGIDLQVNKQPFDHTDKMLYKSIMIEELPNFAMIFGYLNASWTLKSDLISQYVCRLLQYMDKRGYNQCVPQNHDKKIRPADFMDMSSGYFMRALDRLPRQGSAAPWKIYQNYFKDIGLLRLRRIDDKVIQFS